jgi:hypothetical protein
MSELIPFRGKEYSGADADLGDDATEVTLDESAIIPAPRVTHRLPDEPDLVTGLAEVLAAPINLLPPETQAHLRTAGREVALTATSLGATLLKGAAIVLNIAGEALRDYTERNSRVIDLQAARQARQRVEIEVE